MRNSIAKFMDKIIKYDCRWSSELTEQFILDFLNVQKQVFGHCLSKDMFCRKYLNNIYGDSILIVVYIDGSPSAIDGLWRNDINGNKSYQSVDTGVLEQCRGLGIFKEMVRKKVSMVDNQACIYGFPNVNSFSGFIKLGWKLKTQFYPTLMIGVKKFLEIHNGEIIDKEYIKWQFGGRKEYSYIKYWGHYFVVAKRYKSLVYSIIGEADKEVVSLLPIRKKPYLLLYKGTHITFYNKRHVSTRIICKDNNIQHIPCWKLDAI